MNSNILQGKQTNWGMIASWVGVLILLLGLVVYQPLQELRTGIGSHVEDGHPHSVIERIENNETRFIEIMTRMQRELELLEDADKERHVKIEDRMKSAETWINDHRQESPSKHSVHDTRLNTLTAEIDKLRESKESLYKSNVSLEERILDIEREIYAGASYRSGRPTKPKK
jgi:lysyl-tRNA synthetase class I